MLLSPENQIKPINESNSKAVQTEREREEISTECAHRRQKKSVPPCFYPSSGLLATFAHKNPLNPAIGFLLFSAARSRIRFLGSRPKAYVKRKVSEPEAGLCELQVQLQQQGRTASLVPTAPEQLCTGGAARCCCLGKGGSLVKPVWESGSEQIQWISLQPDQEVY